MPKRRFSKKAPPSIYTQGTQESLYPTLSDALSVMRYCIDFLNLKGIKRVHIKALLVAEKLQLHIEDHPSLNALKAECMKTGNNGKDDYKQFIVVINSQIEIVWTRETAMLGDFSKKASRNSAMPFCKRYS